MGSEYFCIEQMGNDGPERGEHRRIRGTMLLHARRGTEGL